MSRILKKAGFPVLEAITLDIALRTLEKPFESRKLVDLVTSVLAR